MRHESVLLEEAVGILRPGPGKRLLDGTLGLGGHARRWLELSEPDGQVVGVDRDAQALSEARRILEGFRGRTLIAQSNYKDCWKVLDDAGIEKVDAMLLDLGVSSLQLDSAERGFSFRADGPLDMRMDPTERVSAETVVNEADEAELAEVLWKYGEERFSRQIARRICEARSGSRIRTTRELEGIIFHAVPKRYRFGRIHPATRSFQALRIAVNGEISSLEDFLGKAPERLNPGGRLAVISFHSLEDRAVKTAFRDAEKKGKMGKVVTKKPMVPTDAECERNPRARSAKLRVFERAS